MFLMAIHLKNSTPINLGFNSKDAADKMRGELADNMWTIFSDDFGTEICVRDSEIVSVELKNLEAVADLHAELQVAQSKAQMLAQKKLAADPIMRAAQGLIAPRNPGFQM